ncbi:hypothetical protein [Fulvivirga sediminis]|uniref:Glycosyltransferase RgtA/B/C/D-like domain-containing protein n=1 Tax=Fulvivirga sediminis TaxID=2803949 RepID=A0A937FC48_9BACT|nr:hypothetical protein [Fulvivirga sediminis]MBL3657838.1 hypothetical protein [Fulvivirga sediminis]
MALTFIIAYAYTFDSKVAMLGDNASYYMLGKALSQGEGYVSISSNSHNPNNHFPPGYPAIISVIMLISKDITFIKVFNGLLLMAGLWLLFEVLLRITENKAFSFTITLLSVLNAHLLFYGSIMMSEVPFFFMSMLSLYFFIQVDFDKWTLKSPALVGSILTMVFAYYIRSLGVAILGGYVLFFLFKKNWKYATTYFMSFVVGFLPWFIRGQNLGGSSYMKQLTMINPYQPALGQAGFGDFVDRFFTNFGRYITWEIPSAIFPIKEPTYGGEATGGEWFLGLVLLGVMIYGIWSLPKFRWLIAGYLLGNFAILMIWPDVWIGVRFIVPLAPLLLFVLLNGIYELVKKLYTALGKKKVLSPVYLCVFVLFAFSPVNKIHDQAKKEYSPAWKNYFAMGTWLKRNVKEKVTVSCGKPVLFYLYSDTYTSRYKFAQDPEELIKDLEEREVDYVVIDQVYGNTFRYLLPAVRKHPERFQRIHHLPNPDTYLLKFKR